MPRSQAHDKRLRKQPKKKPRTWLAVGGKLDDLKLGSKALNGLSSLASDAMKAARHIKLKPMHAEGEEHSLDLSEDSGGKVARRGVRAVGASNLTRRPRHLTPDAAPGGLRRKRSNRRPRHTRSRLPPICTRTAHAASLRPACVHAERGKAGAARAGRAAPRCRAGVARPRRGRCDQPGRDQRDRGGGRLARPGRGHERGAVQEHRRQEQARLGAAPGRQHEGRQPHGPGRRGDGPPWRDRGARPRPFPTPLPPAWHRSEGSR